MEHQILPTMGKRVTYDPKIDALLLPFSDDTTNYSHMLKKRDRAPVKLVVDHLREKGLETYLTGGVVRSQINGEGRHYTDVDLLVSSPADDPNLAFVVFQSYGTKTPDFMRILSLSEYVGVEGRISLDGKTFSTSLMAPGLYILGKHIGRVEFRAPRELLSRRPSLIDVTFVKNLDF